MLPDIGEMHLWIEGKSGLLRVEKGSTIIPRCPRDG
jgi:hypothetical protein